MDKALAMGLATEQRAIASVKIGKRFRQGLGDLTSLVSSIQAVGLLHPIVVSPEGDLIAGRRRLEACRLLGWEHIPAIPVNGVDRYAAERDENVVRVDLRPSEAVAVADHFRPQAEREAKAAQKEHGGTAPGKHSGKLSTSVGKVRDRLGEIAGLSGRTLEKATAVVRAATKAPKKYGDLVAGMDAPKGRVEASYKQLVKRQKAEAKEIPEKALALPDSCRLICGTLASAGQEVATDSLDWIITDPPYPKNYLALHDDLAHFAARALKPGGSLLAMVGQSYLPGVIAALASRLEYHWILAYLTPGGQSAQLWGRKVNAFWKPVLWFVKGRYTGDWVGDVCRSDVNDNDKRFHEWGQSESGMTDIIERFTYPGQMICDPFLGGGTTGVVAVRMGRRFVGIDKDSETIATTKQRLLELGV